MTAPQPNAAPDTERKPDVAAMQRLEDAGYDLIPLHKWSHRDRFERERGKSPRDANWVVEKYAQGWAIREAADGYNVGVRLRDSDLVIDFDPRNLAPDESAATVLAMLELEFGLDLNACPCVATGGGGRHFYLRRAPDVSIRNNLPGLSKAIEFKSFGRQVVAPGSIHPNGTPYTWAVGSPDPSKAPEAPRALLDAIAKPPPRSNGSAEPGAITVDELKECLRQIPVESYRKQHEEWLALLMACHSGTNGSAEGREAFIAWSIADPAYAADGDDIAYRWESFEPNAAGGITVGTLFHHLREAGGVPPHAKAADQFANVEVAAEEGYQPLFDVNDSGVPRNTRNNANEAVKALGIRPRFDEFRKRVVLSGNLSALRRAFPNASAVANDSTAAAVAGVARETWRLELDPGKVHEALFEQAIREPFHSLREWLESLEWDGKERLADWLVKYAGAEDCRYTWAVGCLTLLGAVARAFEPGIKFDTMLVLEGPQGASKSSLVKILGGEFTAEGLPAKELGHADVVDAMQGRWVIELAELESLRRMDVARLKAFISRTEDRARLAYMRATQDFPRQCVFIGTTNDSSYLRDASGGRRFWPVKVGAIDLAGLERDRAQLWAEAVRVWEEGSGKPSSLWLPRELWPVAEAEQEARRAVDPWEEWVAEWLDSKEVHERPSVGTVEVLSQACRKPRERQGQNDWARLRPIMERLGWKAADVRLNGRPVKGYKRPAA